MLGKILMLLLATAAVGIEEQAFRLWQRGQQKEAAPILKHRGGDAGCDPVLGVCRPPARSLEDLKASLGSSFAAALAQNEEEHKRDCAKSCEMFYCGEATSSGKGEIWYESHAFGDVPPEDFAGEVRKTRAAFSSL